MSDPERGPLVTMHRGDAADRLLNEGELAWIHTARRQQLAEVGIDDSLPRGDVILRDIAGASPSEIVRVIKPDLDRKRTALSV